MEKSFESSSDITSLAEDFANDLKNFYGAEELFELYSDSLKFDPNFKNNMSQLERMANIVANPGVGDMEAVANFKAGEVLGYIALIKLEGEDVVERVYEAIRDLYAQDRLRANNYILQERVATSLIKTSEDYRQRLTGAFINDTVDKFFGHNSIPSEEMDIVFKLLSEITDKDEEDEVYDALRGYLFIRSSLSWHERYKDFRAIEKTQTEASELSNLREFYDLIAELEIEEDLADGKIDVSASIEFLIKKIRRDLLTVDIVDEILEDKDEEADKKIDDLIDNAVAAMPELKLEQKVSVEGRGIFVSLGKNLELLDITPIPPGVCVEGIVSSFQIQPTPTEEWLDVLYNLNANESVKSTDIAYDYEGIVMFLDKVFLFEKADNSRYASDEVAYIYIPLGYENTKVYKINEFEG